MIMPDIKVCGITSLEQARQLATLGVQYAGFIFYNKSPRYVVNKILPGELKTLGGIKKTGVFVNAELDDVITTIHNYGLHGVQLHGDELPEFCKQLKQHATVIKAFRILGDEDMEEIVKDYNDAVDYFLFDTKAKEYGGTGKKFDWTKLAQAKLKKPFFLSGGIGPHDAAEIAEFTALQPKFTLDINSKFETEPGVKNMQLVKEFVDEVRTGR